MIYLKYIVEWGYVVIYCYIYIYCYIVEWGGAIMIVFASLIGDLNTVRTSNTIFSQLYFQYWKVKGTHFKVQFTGQRAL